MYKIHSQNLEFSETVRLKQNQNKRYIIYTTYLVKIDIKMSMEELSNSMLSIESLLSTLDGNPEFLHHRVTRGAKKCPPVKTTGFSPFAFLAFILISINTISNISNNISNNNNNNNNNNDDNNNNNLFNSNNKSERRKRKGLQIPGIFFQFLFLANTLGLLRLT